MNQRLNEFTPVELIIVVRVVHLKVMELQFLVCHLACVDWHIHMFSNVSKNKPPLESSSFGTNCSLTLSHLEHFPYGELAAVVRDVRGHDCQDSAADYDLHLMALVADGQALVGAGQAAADVERAPLMRQFF